MKTFHLRRSVLVHGLCALALAAQGPAAGPAAAQARGNTQALTSDLTFQTGGQSMWTAGTSFNPFSFGVPLFDVETGPAGDSRSTSAGIPRVGEVRLTTNLNADLGLSAALRLRVADGTVGVTYPARVQVTVPERNSFRRGEPVVIGTAYSLRPGGALVSQPASVTATLSAAADLSFSAGGEACMSHVGCANLGVPSVDIHPDLDVLQINSNGTVTVPWIPGLSIDALRHNFTQVEEHLWDIKPYDSETGRGFVDRFMVPVVSGVAADGRTLIGDRTHRFLSVALDLDAKICKNPLNPCLGEAKASFDVAGFKLAWIEWEIADLAENFDLDHHQRFEFHPSPTIRLTFPEAVSWSELAPDGGVLRAGHGSEVTVAVGNSLRVTFPEHRADAMGDLPARVRMANTFSSESRIDYAESISARAGVKLDAGTYSKTFFGFPYPCPSWDDPFDICHANITAPALDIPALGPLLTRHWTMARASANLFPRKTWELEGFPEKDAAPWFLDPERPVISMATSIANTTLVDGTTPGAVTQTIRVRNPGDVALAGVLIANAISMDAGAGGFTVLDVRSPGDPRLTPNPAFDGTGVTDVLTGADRISGDSANALTWTVEAVIALEPGDVYRWDLHASGTSPIGTLVGDGAAASLAVYEFDLVPRRLQVGSRGQIPASIRSTRELDARRVDPASVTLEGVPPTRWEWADRDGLVDLDLKFDQEAVAEALLARLDRQATAAPAVRGTVAPPALSVHDVARELLRGGTGTTAQAADERGNRNGRLDVGDLRALLMERAQPRSAAAPKGVGTAHRSGTTLVVEGTLSDGTTFYAEDDIVVERRQP